VDVLAYSRVSRERMELRPIDVKKLIQSLIRENPIFQPPKAEVIFEGPALKVLGHEAALTQVATNLLQNAVKFVASGTVPRITIRTESFEGQVRVGFQDNGIGIAPPDLQRIFSLFERVHPTQHYEGTGLGLAIVRKAVERMGGRVGVESALGQGSRFWIQLPLAEDSKE
jgi:signal transduction histidine kinase